MNKYEKEIEQFLSEIKELQENSLSLRNDYYRGKIPFKEYNAERKQAIKKIKSLNTKINYRKNKLAGDVQHEDQFGQPIVIGSTVAWGTSSTYAGFTVDTVKSTSVKQIQLSRWGSTYPKNIIVVDKLIGDTE